MNAPRNPTPLSSVLEDVLGPVAQRDRELLLEDIQKLEAENAMLRRLFKMAYEGWRDADSGKSRRAFAPLRAELEGETDG